MRIKFLHAIVIILSGILLTGCSVKALLKTGDKAYDNYLYNDAINAYEGIGKKKRDTHVLSRLADSYRLTGQSVKSETYYAQLEQNGALNNEDLLRYAQVLKMNGKYDQSIQKMQQHDAVVSSDSRVDDHLSNTTYYSTLQQDQGQFALTNLKLNSAEEDFGTSYYLNKVVFVSSRRGVEFTSYEYNWNVKSFLNLYSFQQDKTNKARVHKIKPVQVKGGLNKKFHEGPATFNADGTLMIFTRDRYTKNTELNGDQVRVLELWYSEKDTKGKWGKPQPVNLNNKEYSVGHATLTPDGNTLYFVSDMPGGFGQSDIYYSVRNTDGSWGTPVNAGKNINTEGKEMFPFYHQKGLLFYSSDGKAGLGGLDVFMATAKNNKLGTSKNLGSALNSTKDDLAFIMDAEMKTGYVSSNREGGKGNDDIYRVDILKPFKLTKKLEGIAREKTKGTILPGTAVTLKDKEGNVVAQATSDQNGYYSFEVEPGMDFTLQGSMDKHKEGNATANTHTGDEVITANLDLEKIPEIGLQAFVSDAKSGTPLPGTHLVVKEQTTGNLVADVYTDAEGYWLKDLENAKINDKLAYSISLSKDGYVEKTVNFNYVIDKEGIIKIHNNLDLTLGKIEVGTDIGKLININPIYFDLGKSTIRPDAARELDKIVDIMNKYPGIVIELGSHTDCRSSMSSNQALSDKRAKSSAAYIISKGISPERIYGKGYGETELLNGCKCEGKVKSTCSEEEHQLNRRTVFRIVKINDNSVKVQN